MIFFSSVCLGDEEESGLMALLECGVIFKWGVKSISRRFVDMAPDSGGDRGRV